MSLIKSATSFNLFEHMIISFWCKVQAMINPFLGLGDETTREIIKEKLKDDFGVNIARDDGDIAFITYNKGETEAFIR